MVSFISKVGIENSPARDFFSKCHTSNLAVFILIDMPSMSFKKPVAETQLLSCSYSIVFFFINILEGVSRM